MHVVTVSDPSTITLSADATTAQDAGNGRNGADIVIAPQ